MNLVPLFEEALEFQNYNGTVLSNGKVAVFYIGRTRLADIFNDIEGLSPAENPRILDNLGMGPIYVNPAFDYEMVVYDAYDNELFSVKKYVLSKGEHSTANVVVTPSEHIAVSAWTIGDVQVYMPYLVGEVGKVYEGIDPIVVNNDVNRISANHIPLGVQDPLYFVEDSETACIIGCSAQTEIPVELSGKWDEASDAVIANSAQWAEGTEYEAGSYVDIDGHTISVTGLQPEGDYAYNSALSSKLDVTATGQFLTGLPEDLMYSGDMTAYQPAGDYQTAGNYQTAGDYLSASDSANFLLTGDSANFLLTSDSGNFYPMEGNPSGFLTAHQSLDDYATKQWVEDKGYITGIDIQESANWNSTTETVSSHSAQWGASNPQIPVTGINGIKISESGDQVVFEVSANYATEDWVTGQGYLTAETDWTNTITAASANAYEQATAAIPTGLATTGDLQTVSGEITALIPSTAGLATEDWVTAQGYLTTAYTPDFAYHDSAISAIDESALYDTSAHARINTLAGRINTLSSDKADVTALADYQTTAGMTAYMTTGDSAEFMTTAERSDYIPTGVSSEFYTTANTAGYISTIPDTYLQNADLSTEDGKVTAISGIPLSAGGDVPEGVMVESGLEYNAVQEISGYNGSAIAQYGAEKQWLVHDDTLVHLSNSAQYALGVAIDNVASLMGGVDETVLFDGSITGYTSAQLSENVNNFNRVKVFYSRDNAWTLPLINSIEMCTDILSGQLHGNFTMGGIAIDFTNNMAGWYYATVANITDDIVSAISGRNYNMAGTATFDGNFCLIKRIIGIGRKEV